MIRHDRRFALRLLVLLGAGMILAPAALAEPYVGRAGAAATVAGAAALMMILLGLFILAAARPKPKPAPPPTPEGLFDRALAFIKEKPILSASAALGAGLLAVTNPKYLGVALRAFVEGREPRR